MVSKISWVHPLQQRVRPRGMAQRGPQPLQISSDCRITASATMMVMARSMSSGPSKVLRTVRMEPRPVLSTCMYSKAMEASIPLRHRSPRTLRPETSFSPIWMGMASMNRLSLPVKPRLDCSSVRGTHWIGISKGTARTRWRCRDTPVRPIH